MGYYTDFNINIELQNEEEIREDLVKDIIKKLVEITGYEEGSWDSYSPDHIYMNGKWYESLEDMKKVSLAFPTLLFTVEGKGEGEEDIWTEWTKNGKGYHEDVKIIYPEYDESKMI
jgi:hypothetical protein